MLSPDLGLNVLWVPVHHQMLCAHNLVSHPTAIKTTSTSNRTATGSSGLSHTRTPIHKPICGAESNEKRISLILVINQCTLTHSKLHISCIHKQTLHKQGCDEALNYKSFFFSRKMDQRDGKTEADFNEYVYADVYPSVCGLLSAPKPLERFFLKFCSPKRDIY